MSDPIEKTEKKRPALSAPSTKEIRANFRSLVLQLGANEALSSECETLTNEKALNALILWFLKRDARERIELINEFVPIYIRKLEEGGIAQEEETKDFETLPAAIAPKAPRRSGQK